MAMEVAEEYPEEYRLEVEMEAPVVLEEELPVVGLEIRSLQTRRAAEAVVVEVTGRKGNLSLILKVIHTKKTVLNILVVPLHFFLMLLRE